MERLPNQLTQFSRAAKLLAAPDDRIVWQTVAGLTIMKSEIEKAADRCRAAFAEYPNATHAWCCHHEVFYEQLTEPAENRIQFILKNKNESEQVARLNNFRPVRDWAGKLAPLDADYEAKCASLYADYEAKRAPLYADYEAKCATLDADYKAKCATLMKPIKKLYKQEVPLGTWNGKSIFK